MPQFRNVRQAEAVTAFVRVGGLVRPGKGSHVIVNMPNGANLSIPAGVVKIGLLRHLVRISDKSEDEFGQALSR